MSKYKSSPHSRNDPPAPAPIADEAYARRVIEALSAKDNARFNRELHEARIVQSLIATTRLK